MTRTSIGKFQVVGQLGRGGMAEIFVCRLQGIGGFDKEVVVKRIIPERAGDPHFVKMFLDEARVAANLNHPNIVQVFEIGEQDGIPYIAMEYVKGVTLGMIIREAHRQKKLHYGHFAKIIAGICEALDYAHNALNANGEPLGLVHRDVSPGNIVVSREGIPKLLDFGVAKAKGRLAQTEAGTLKGKLRYMAPEQISQGPLDNRADIFSLGVCLFELATGRNPFGPQGGNEVAILKNIVNGVFSKPSELVPDFPPDLEAIVLSAIEQDVHKRCASARELRDKLEGFAATAGNTSNTRDMVAWLKDLFPDFGTLTRTGGLAAFTGTSPTGSLPLTPSGTRLPLSSTEIPALGEGGSYGSGGYHSLTRSQGGGSIPGSMPPPRGGGAWKWAALATVAAAGAGGLYVWKSQNPPPAPVVQAPVAPVPSAPTVSDDDAAKAYLDAAEKLAKERRFDPALDMLAKASELKIKSPDLNIRLAQMRDTLATGALLKKARNHLKEKEWRAAIDAAKNALDRDPDNAEAVQIIASARAGIEPRAAEPITARAKDKERLKDGTLTITTTPPSAMVYVDDEPIGRSPIRGRPISVGKHVIQVRAQGYKPGEAEVKVNPKQVVSLVLPLVAEASSPGSRPVVREEESAPAHHDTPPAVASRPSGTGSTPGENPPAPENRPPAPTPTPARLNVPTPTPPPTASAPPPAPVAPAAAVPVKPSGSTPTSSAPVLSSVPKGGIQRPTLPRVFVAKDAEQLSKVCQLVESQVIAAGGLNPEFVRGITGPLKRLVGINGEVYPVAMYYFIIREAGLKRDNKTAAANLASAQSNGIILKFKDLPANVQNL